jgi:hypothetical protein
VAIAGTSLSPVGKGETHEDKQFPNTLYKSDSRRSLPKRSYKNEARDWALLACTHGPRPGKPQTTGTCNYSPDDTGAVIE